MDITKVKFDLAKGYVWELIAVTKNDCVIDSYCNVEELVWETASFLPFINYRSEQILYEFSHLK